MRVFALSDLHVDFPVNAGWVTDLSRSDYRDDLLILAGDLTDSLRKLEWCLSSLAACFRKVLFVPGNHELWVAREGLGRDSLEKFAAVAAVAESSGASMRPLHAPGLSICPLLSWYDFSFGEPDEELRSVWMDFEACLWPTGWDEPRVAAHFEALNQPAVAEHLQHNREGDDNTVITFSHFMPRIDLLPAHVPPRRRMLDPVLGTTRLESQLRKLAPSIHVYGHSHINRNVRIDGITYINNAYGYPSESRIAAKRLLCIHEP